MGEVIGIGRIEMKIEELDPNHVYSFWHLLPDLLLEKVFQYLTLCERYAASMVSNNALCFGNTGNFDWWLKE